MSKWRFTKGLHDIGNGLYAYLQPDGGWGWSNAGLIESRGHTLLVDTLMNVVFTREMLDEMKRKVPASAKIEKLVNTHANLDHFGGNELVAGAEIIATKLSAQDIAATKLDAVVEALENKGGVGGEAGAFLYEMMGRHFDLRGVTLTPPTRTFEVELSLTVGDKAVKLIDLGPAHTKSDTLVYVPADKTLFTGDLLFNEGTALMWAGPVQNWIKACDYMLALDVEIIVPGHGPIADKASVRHQKAYFEYVHREAKLRFDSGMPWEEAARDMSLGEFAKLNDSERIVGNVFALYREFGAVIKLSSEREVYGAMARWRRMNDERKASTHTHGGHH
jgi:cyclase